MTSPSDRVTRRGPHPFGRWSFVAALILLPGALAFQVALPSGIDAAHDIEPSTHDDLVVRAVTLIPTADASQTSPSVRRAPSQPDRRSGASESRRRGGDPLRALGADPLTAIIDVAADISPAWADELSARRAEDPDALRSSIVQNGPRLVALAILRDHQPQLYLQKVDELRHQAETAATVAAYREAVSVGDAERADALLQVVRDLVKRQVDHDLKTKGLELAALAHQLEQLRSRLTEDAINRESLISDKLSEVLADEGIAPRGPLEATTAR